MPCELSPCAQKTLTRLHSLHQVHQASYLSPGWSLPGLGDRGSKAHNCPIGLFPGLCSTVINE